MVCDIPTLPTTNMDEEKKNMYEDLLIKPDEEGIRLAADMLLRGSIVAFPTETVVSG